MFLEPIFALMYYMGFTYTEAYGLPLFQRMWFIQRLNKEITKSDNQESRAHHNNSPEQRMLSGKQRTQSPARLRRFT